MNLLEQHFEEALRGLPRKKLSFMADLRLRRKLKQAARELEGASVWTIFIRQLVAAPLAACLILLSVSAYAYESPSVVQGDLLYSVKDKLETFLYPSTATSEKRMAYHLWLSDRRYDEAKTILARREGDKISWIMPALAHDSPESASKPLDDILVDTLDRATEQVDLALLVTEEMQDPTQLQIAKESIQQAIFKHRDFLQKSGTQLKKVRLHRRPRARHQIQAFPPPLPLSTSEQLVSTASSLTSGARDSFKEVSLPDFTPLLLSDGKDLLEDHLAFQQELVEKLGDESPLRMSVADAIESADDDEHDQPLRFDQTVINGMVIHYEHQSKAFEKEGSPRNEGRLKQVKMRLEKAKMRRNLK